MIAQAVDNHDLNHSLSPRLDDSPIDRTQHPTESLETDFLAHRSKST